MPPSNNNERKRLQCLPKYGRKCSGGRQVVVRMWGWRVVNAVGRGANARGARRGSRRRRGASEAAIDEARTRLAHATAATNYTHC